MSLLAWFASSEPVRGQRGVRLTGVSCDVESCRYHDGDRFCTAPHIKVGPGYATARTDTVCATYEQKALSRSKR